MGVLNWRGMPVTTGDEWAGVSYFTTLRLSVEAGPEDMGRRPPASGAGASTAPYDTFNLGGHVGDRPEAVLANRERLAALLPGAPVWLDQVHGTRVFDADTGLAGTAGVPQADAAITCEPGRVLCIMTADCLPVVLSDRQGTVLGAAHAGWRGLAAGVLENTLSALRARAPADAPWRAWVGPAIGQPAFEVGEEVRQAFVEHDPLCGPFFAPGQPGKWQADLAGLAVRRLQRAGVHDVQASGLCTHARDDLFYSYRRDGPTGRMATVAWLTGGK